MSDIEFRTRALAISIRSLSRYLTDAIDGVASGSSSVWHIRKRANREFVAIFGQMAQLGVVRHKQKENK